MTVMSTTGTATTGNFTGDHLNTADLFLRESARGTGHSHVGRFPRPRGGHLPAAELPAAVVGYAGLHATAGSERAGLTGVIPSWHDLQEHLTSAGFAESDIAASGLSRAVTAAAGPLAEVDCLHVPALPGHAGLLCFRRRGDVAGTWKTIACGDVAVENVSDAIIVSDPAEAAALRAAGLTQTFCIPGLESVDSDFWASLADAGVDRVVLLSNAANGEWATHLKAADAAARAETTPAVRLHELPESCGRSAADDVRRDGAAAFAARLFADVAASTPGPLGVATPPRFDRDAFWSDVRPSIEALSDPMHRRLHERLAAEVCDLLAAGRVDDANAALDGRPTPAAMLPTSTSHHVENVRCAAAGPAIARRVFELLRTTGAELAIASPSDRDALLRRLAEDAEGSGGGVFAERTAAQLLDELRLMSDRIRVVTTPQPQAVEAAQFRLFAGADVILLDLTTQQTAFWWQQNGWCGRLTELAESADADLVAFWPAATPRRTAGRLQSDVLGRMRAWVREL